MDGRSGVPFGRSVFAKLLTVFAAIIVFSSALGILSQSWIVSKFLNRLVVEGNLRVAERIASEIRLFVTNLIAQLEVTAQRIELTAGSSYRGDIVLGSLVQKFPHFDRISIFDEKGNILSDSDLCEDNDLYIDLAMEKGLSGGEYISPVYFHRGLPTMVVAIPLMKWRKPAGVLVGRIGLRAVWDLVDSMKLGETGYAYLASQDGRLIAHPDKTLVLREGVYGDRRSVQLALGGFSGRVDILDERGGGVIEVYAPVRDLGWGVILRQSKDEAFKIGRKLIYISVFVFCATIIVMFCAGIYLDYRISKPLLALADAARRFGRGDLSFRLNLKSGDEVGEVARSFNIMAERLDTLYRDLEERVRESTEDLREANRELKELDGLKSTFLSIVSHELRTPLTVIKGYVRSILEGDMGDISPKVRESLELVIRKATHLISLVSELLDVSRIESGKFELNIGAFELRALVEDSIEAMRLFADERSISLDCSLPPEPIPVSVDGDRIVQVITNLLSNSLKFTPSGGRVSVSAAVENGSAIISVSDTGPGIPPSERDKIFNRFYQAASGARVVGGMGLGLAISREIVSLHGGEIWVEDNAEGGSTFKFTLPLHSRSFERAGGVEREPSKESSPDPASIPGARILLADDDPHILSMTVRLLERGGYRVVTAVDGVDALDKALGEGEFDLIILDLRMPKLDGWEVSRILRGKNEIGKMAVIFLSAAGFESIPPEGGVDIVPKPFDGEVLLSAIGRALSSPRGDRQAPVPSADAGVSARDDFLSSVCHDLRGVATDLKLLAQNSRDFGDDPDFLSEAWRIVSASAARVEELSERLRPSNGRRVNL
ncbi:MAG: ATP-binding protein [bacterium]